MYLLVYNGWRTFRELASVRSFVPQLINFVKLKRVPAPALKLSVQFRRGMRPCSEYRVRITKN